MEKPAARELEQLHAAWLERFGEPPPIIAEPEIMRRVLSQVLARSHEAAPNARTPGAWRTPASRGVG
jgi:hypothetical protein